MFKEDRIFLENKYHKISEPFNPYARMAYHGYDFDKSTGIEDVEIKKGLTELYEEIKALPHPVAKAKAVEYVLENTKIDINEHDWFVGFWSVGRLSNAVTTDKWYTEIFEKKISKTNEIMNEMNKSGAVSIWADFDHVVPDWDSILNFGFSGLIKRAEHYKEKHIKNGTLTSEKEAFFDGIIIEYKAIVAIVDRMYKYALTKSFEKAKKIAECLKNIRDNTPKNIYEAMQVIYIYFIISECFDSYQVRSLGNGLDSSLYRFYKNDLENNTFTKEEIKEFLRYFLFQWQAIGNYWGQPFYMGGTNTDGSTKYNELSYDILDVYDEIGIYNPKIQLKINEKYSRKTAFQSF